MMGGAFYLALRYLIHHRGRSLVLIASIALIAILPILIQMLATQSDRLLRARALDTPLVAGAKGSALDLVMNTLYFAKSRPDDIPVSASGDLLETGLAVAIPVHVRHLARGYRVVGTDIDYVFQRNLPIASGHAFTRIGDALIGADVAENLGLKPGDTVTTSPDTVFDLAGAYPMKLSIVGVLAKTGNADDKAILVDLRTTWTISGYFHGHEDLRTTKDQSVVLERKDGRVIANAKLREFTQVTDNNAASFHLHGDEHGLPVTGILLFPHSQKDSTLLQGRFVYGFPKLQIQKPVQVVERMLRTLFDIGAVLNGVIGVVAVSTLFVLVLVFATTIRLREAEFETNTKIGAPRWTTVKLVGAEIVLLVAAAAIVVAILALTVRHAAPELTVFVLDSFV